jgi:hypothetical protein
MDKVELIQLIQRLSREFPRHRDIIALCTACEALALAKPVPMAGKPRLSRAEIQRNYRQRQKASKPIRLPSY